MATSAWVCFNCRSAVRRNSAFRGEVPCPICSKGCTFLGYRIPVPPKQKVREWAALREQLFRERTARDIREHEMAVRQRHDLEQEIVRLESMPANPGRTRAAQLLRRQLAGSNA